MSGYECPTGRSSDFARPDVTEAVLRKLEGSGATPEDRGVPGPGTAPEDFDITVVSPSPRLPVSPYPRIPGLPVSPSPRLPVFPSP